MCSDIDGTLLNAKRDIAPETAAAVNKLPQDFPIILASSRMPSASIIYRKKLDVWEARSSATMVVSC